MAGPVRQPIDLPSLERYLESHTTLRGPLSLQQFGYGQSNPTYLLTCASTNCPGTRTSVQKFVLRKKPPGSLLNPTAHAVEREHRVLAALAPTPVPVPTPVTLCEDSSVIGSPFYIMSFLKGRIFSDPSIPGVSAEERGAMWTDVLRTLGTLHKVNPKSVRLESFGKPSGFYSRQLKTLTTISKAQAESAGPIPGFESLTTYFAATQPEDATTVVHGDYKIDNIVFHPSEPRVIGILDWELSTLGHPLSDLSNLLTPYITAISPGASVTPGTSGKEFLPNATPGLLTIEGAVKVYEQASGRKVAALKWGMAFGFLRNAVITQGITARVERGQASSERAVEYREVTPRLSSVARGLCESDRIERRIKLGLEEEEKSKL